MGSDENPETVTNTCSSSSSEPTTVAQDSSVFGSFSNLSPVRPFKDASLLQGFPGIISSSNVSTLPHINAQSSFSNRQQQCHTSSSGFSRGSFDLEKTKTTPDDPERMISQLNIAVESRGQKGTNATAYNQLQTADALVAVEALLLLPVDGECIDAGSREHHDDTPKTLESNMAKKDRRMDNCLTSETSMMFKQANACSHGGFITVDSRVKDEKSQFVSTSEVWSNKKCGDSLNEVNEVISGGGLRRCLQFGEHQHKSIKENPADTTERQISISDLSHNLSLETPCDRHVADQSEFASTKCFSSCTSAVVSKPRGIGLHLNSIVACPPRGLVRGKRSSKGMVKLEGKSLILSGSVHPRAKFSDNVVQTTSFAECDMYIREPVEMVNPSKLLSSNSVDALESPVPLSSVCEELGESTEVLNETGSITGRKQASTSTDPDGCKRCSCKKSQCLKLYCDCFAAGLFCLDSCSCKGCFNRQEFKDLVIEARQQIESRNPLAFAPRIMQHVTNSPTNSGESVESVAPPSLRHKRGCSCRKSMCLKKYCECYQSNVGCSDGCRCDGCKNVYGKKPDYCVIRHNVNKRTFDEISEEIPDQKRKLLITNRSHVSSEKVDDLPVVVPKIPVLSCSDSRKNEMKSLLPGRRYVLSPEPNLRTPPSGIHQSSSKSSLVQHGSRNPAEAIQLMSSTHGGLPGRRYVLSPAPNLRTPPSEIHRSSSKSCVVQHSSRNLAEAIKLTSSPHGGLPGRRTLLSPEANLHPSPSGIHQSSSESSVVQHGSRNPAEAILLTSSTHGGLVNLCHFTQLKNPLQMTAAPPSSIARDVQKAPPLSPFCDIARSKTPDHLHATGWPADDTVDDDTPAILRYSPAPMKSVKVSSPNKKRISPPHNHLNDLQPISSGQLKSSRKYVFRSVPKFPTLSPCIDSKGPSDPPA